MDNDKYAKKIKAKIIMISGSEDKQTSADVFNVNQFQLPNPAGKAGGACTSTLIQVLHRQGSTPLTWMDLLHKMRTVLLEKGFDQVPQLSASRLIDVQEKFEIVPPRTVQHNGARRAILIGINYVGQQGQLSGCHNDVGNIKQYLINNQGFKEKDMLILMDDGQHHPPTKKNIQDSFKRITEYSRANDVVFIHYSGHGGRVEDLNGDEKDGYDETLIPSDYKKAGQILDDDVYKMVVDPMPEGVTVVALMDCCHSGSAMDLPYEMNETDSGGMHENKGFGGMGAIMEEPAAMICCACLAFLFVDGLLDFLG